MIRNLRTCCWMPLVSLVLLGGLILGIDALIIGPEHFDSLIYLIANDCYGYMQTARYLNDYKHISTLTIHLIFYAVQPYKFLYAPAYYFILAGLYDVFGFSLLSSVLLNCFFYLMTLVLIYLAAKKLYNTKCAYLSGLMFIILFPMAQLFGLLPLMEILICFMVSLEFVLFLYAPHSLRYFLMPLFCMILVFFRILLPYPMLFLFMALLFLQGNKSKKQITLILISVLVSLIVISLAEKFLYHMGLINMPVRDMLILSLAAYQPVINLHATSLAHIPLLQEILLLNLPVHPFDWSTVMYFDQIDVPTWRLFIASSLGNTILFLGQMRAYICHIGGGNVFSVWHFIVLFVLLLWGWYCLCSKKLVGIQRKWIVVSQVVFFFAFLPSVMLHLSNPGTLARMSFFGIIFLIIFSSSFILVFFENSKILGKTIIIGFFLSSFAIALLGIYSLRVSLLEEQDTSKIAFIEQQTAQLIKPDNKIIIAPELFYKLAYDRYPLQYCYLPTNLSTLEKITQRYGSQIGYLVLPEGSPFGEKTLKALGYRDEGSFKISNQRFTVYTFFNSLSHD